MSLELTGALFAGLMAGTSGTAAVAALYARRVRSEVATAHHETHALQHRLTTESEALASAQRHGDELKEREQANRTRLVRAMEDVRSRLEETQEKLQSAETKLSLQRVSLADAQTQARRGEQLLDLLGIDVPTERWSPTAADRRAQSQRALVELLASVDIDGAALVDRRGLVGMFAGPAEVAQELAVTQALLVPAQRQLSMALCAPLLGASMRRASRVFIYRPLPGSSWRLALAARGPVPEHALRNAVFALTGRPTVAASVPELPSDVRERVPQLDPAAQEVLERWCERYDASALLLDAAGNPIAEHDVAVPIGALRTSLAPWFQRSIRDGEALSSCELRAHARHAHAVVRPIHDHRETAVLLTMSVAPPSPDTLDELVGALQWKLLSGADRAAS